MGTLLWFAAFAVACVGFWLLGSFLGHRWVSRRRRPPQHTPVVVFLGGMLHGTAHPVTDFPDLMVPADQCESSDTDDWFEGLPERPKDEFGEYLLMSAGTHQDDGAICRVTYIHYSLVRSS